MVVNTTAEARIVGQSLGNNMLAYYKEVFDEDGNLIRVMFQDDPKNPDPELFTITMDRLYPKPKYISHKIEGENESNLGNRIRNGERI